MQALAEVDASLMGNQIQKHSSYVATSLERPTIPLLFFDTLPLWQLATLTSPPPFRQHVVVQRIVLAS